MLEGVKRISIQALKASLSTAVAEAESGKTVVITRHSQPVARLTPFHDQHVHYGARVGEGRLRPAVKRGTKGRYLETLLDDRGDR
jgi:prevent-host-death family protein